MSYVTITPLLGSRPVRVLLGSQPATPVADGGWVVQARPKRSGFTVWDGYAPHTMELSVMFDGFARDESQDSDIEALRLIMRTPVGPTKQPSPVNLEGPVPMPDTSWVIQSLTIDPATVLRRSDGSVLRAAATLGLVEYVEADFLVAAVAASSSPVQAVVASAPEVAPETTYTVQAGDTVHSIAARHLGHWNQYTNIMRLNPRLRDPRRATVGTVLILS